MHWVQGSFLVLCLLSGSMAVPAAVDCWRRQQGIECYREAGAIALSAGTALMTGKARWEDPPR